MMSEPSTNESIQSPGASLPPPPAPSSLPVVSSSLSGNNELEKQKSANNANARSALVASIEEGTKLTPTKHIQPPQSRSSIVFGSSTDPSKSCGSQVHVKPMNECFMPSDTTSKMVQNLFGAPESAKSTKNTPARSKRKLSADDVQICSCFESATIGGANKCSHSGPNAIHLNMDKVMLFLAQSER